MRAKIVPFPRIMQSRELEDVLKLSRGDVRTAFEAELNAQVDVRNKSEERRGLGACCESLFYFSSRVVAASVYSIIETA